MSRPKLSDIAKAAGVSVSTVSMALGDYPDVSAVTRLRVRELCQQMNYKPRRKGARRRAREAAARAASENRTLRIAVTMVGSS